jgi:hypothetical protein
MQLFRLRSSLVCGLAFSIVACSTSRLPVANQTNADIKSLHFLGEYDINYGQIYANTTVGGLSGIDYDPAKNCYYMICDDRSAINPARFYTAKILFTQKGIDTVYFTAVNTVKQPSGEPYPNNKQDRYNTPDPEAMRYNQPAKNLIWTSEGERIIREKDTVLADPAIRIVDLSGKFLDSFPIPANFHMQTVEKGPRQNSTFEGITFADNFKTVFVSVEEPLYEDGPRADTGSNDPFIRILKFDVEQKKNLSQYAYKLDPVAYPASPANAFKINGVPDILSVGRDKLLVIERSFSSGRLACTIKVFLADLSNATDIKNNPSLRENKDFKASEKKLLLNMDDLGFYTDNIEGVTFGPTLPNGHKTLLFVADNNFSPLEKSQILLFEIFE